MALLTVAALILLLLALLTLALLTYGSTNLWQARSASGGSASPPRSSRASSRAPRTSTTAHRLTY
eukprot:scaffold36535_cov62-Phaeocystis_antarctica.AAC.1